MATEGAASAKSFPAERGLALARQVEDADAASNGLAAGWVESLDEARSVLKATFQSGKTKSYEWRKGQIKAMERLFMENVPAIIEAYKRDHNRPEYEVLSIDIGGTLSEIRFISANLRKWMAPEKVTTPLLAQPGDSRIERVPKGIVLIFGAWNAPFNLSLLPVATAIAAGNCAVLKPSEVSPATEMLMAELCPRYLDQDAVRVFTGGLQEATAMLERPWDHIFYTGNGAVARTVMAAAAKHLCPVTLELGGKSPCFVDRGLSKSQLEMACRRIASASLFVMGGQLCVAPDYVLVHKDAEKELLQELRDTIAKFAPSGVEASTAHHIVNKRHWDRVKRLVDTSGGQVFTALGSSPDRNACFFPPTVVSRPAPESAILSEEIFGPVLLVMPVDSLEAAAEFINERETPLALYVFTPSRGRGEAFAASTRSGGVLINDVLLHLANQYLPFGGVGASGMGAYHGKFGFDEFSHKRAIMARRLWADIDRYPPYDAAKVQLIKRVQLGPLLPCCLL